MIDVSLAAYMQAATVWAVQQNSITALNEDETGRVWFQRREANTDLFNNGSFGLTTTLFDVEVMSLDIDSAIEEADTIKATLHGFSGEMGTDAVLLCVVQDANDEYVAKNLGDDSGFTVAAFNVRIIQP